MQVNSACDIVVVAGQSNAEGYGIGPVTHEYIPDDKILLLTNLAEAHFEKNADGKDELKLLYPAPNRIEVADEQGEGRERRGLLALFFAKNYVQSGCLQSGRKLLIVNAAVGGTGFARNEWGVGNILYRRLTETVEYALGSHPQNRVVAFLWHQGECDSVENPDWEVEKRYLVHKKNLTEMFSDFLRRFAPGGIPVIAGGFCDEWYLQHKTECDAVLRATQEACASCNGAFVQTQGLLSNNQKTGNGDDIHFCRESLHILGERYFEKYKEIVTAFQ